MTSVVVEYPVGPGTVTAAPQPPRQDVTIMVEVVICVMMAVVPFYFQISKSALIKRMVMMLLFRVWVWD